MSDKPQKTEKKPDFETGIKRLEEIAALLEKGEVPLEKSLELYEEGRGIANLLGGILSDAERRVMLLTSDAEGRPLAVPFDNESN